MSEGDRRRPIPRVSPPVRAHRDAEAGTVDPPRRHESRPAWQRIVSDDPGEVAEKMASGMRDTFAPAPVGRTFFYDRSFRTLGPISFMASQGPARAAMATPSSPSMFTVALVTAGVARAENAVDRWSFGPSSSAVLPTGSHLVTYNHDSVVDAVSLDAEGLRRLAAEVAHRDEVHVAFPTPAPHTVEHARFWWATVRYVNQAVVDSSTAASSPMVRSEAFRLLGVSLLDTFPYEIVGDRTEGGDHVEPAVIRRAVEVIESHAHRPALDTAAIAAASGVGVRALQLGFRRHRGTTPMAYLRRVRLARAHEDLRRGDPSRGDSVTEIAARWGFASPSHFAVQYRAAYGVRPSESLRR